MAELVSSKSTQNLEQGVRKRRAPLPRLGTLLGLWLPGLLVAGGVLLPIAYLVLRASQADSAIWDLLLRTRTLEITLRTLWLAFSVTLASVAIAVPIAWLTTRSDIPYRRLWAVLTPLPLVIPSFVGAYLFISTLGPRGLIQSWLEPLGVMRLPPVYGYPGAVFVLTMMSYPFVLLSARAA
ncbi:MAG: iron ABC transporter permease, partial [Chloroflexi bacterium]|nr:iron ABC transporter permease [Chloroflexota bacterium]NOH14561.1 iron ABC transporter permease [Chloroflexota bacterium]